MSLAHAEFGQQERHRQRRAGFDRVHKQRIAEHIDRGNVQQAASQPADPEMILHTDEVHVGVEPQIERCQDTAQKRQRLTRDAKTRLERDPPAAAQDRQTAQPGGRGQDQLVLKDSEAGQPDDQAQHAQAAAQGQHPLDTARIQQGLEHPPQGDATSWAVRLWRCAGRVEELMDLRRRRSRRRRPTSSAWTGSSEGCGTCNTEPQYGHSPRFPANSSLARKALPQD